MPVATCNNCSFMDTTYLGNSCGTNFGTFLGVVELLFAARCEFNEACNRLGQDGLPPLDAEYDFIVVGAGVAGPVVASRLSEPPAGGGKPWSVLLLEAGPEEPTLSSIPAFAFATRFTQLDWLYYSEEENACFSTGKKCLWPRGRMVGGTGAMTGMMYTRGHRSIYDDWAAAGNEGWSYEEVLPYFKKSEKMLNPELMDAGYHGVDGPLTVRRFKEWPPFAEDLVKAGAEMGFRAGDFSGDNQTNFGFAPVMNDADGLRSSTSRAFLRPHVNERPHLRLITDVHVTRVLIDESLGRATGVGYLLNGKEVLIRAKKEVILTAGAIGSPQILMLSGIGPKEDLEYIGQQCVIDLPGVGKNLHNHVSADVPFFIDDDNYQTLSQEALDIYFKSKEGPMSNTAITQVTAMMESKYAPPGVPDIQVFFDGFNANCSATGSSTECVGGQPGPCPGHRRKIVARPTNVSPLSRGSLMIRDTSPSTYPKMSAAYFSNERDLEVLVDGMMKIAELPKTNAMKKWGMVLDTTPVEGCEHETFGTEAYWKCSAIQSTGPENHQSGSVKMGPKSDPMAVVDPQLRIHGLPNLRVADASVFPTVPNGNPIPAVIMVAEKVADFIKDEYKYESLFKKTREEITEMLHRFQERRDSRQ